MRKWAVLLERISTGALSETITFLSYSSENDCNKSTPKVSSCLINCLPASGYPPGTTAGLLPKNKGVPEITFPFSEENSRKHDALQSATPKVFEHQGFQKLKNRICQDVGDYFLEQVSQFASK